MLRVGQVWYVILRGQCRAWSAVQHPRGPADILGHRQPAYRPQRPPSTRPLLPPAAAMPPIPREKRCQEPLLRKGWGLDSIAGMGRPLRTTAGGLVYHVLNRANARMQIFDNEKHYDAFERILDEAAGERRPFDFCRLAYADPYPTRARPSPFGRLGARVSRAIQAVSGGVGRSLVVGLSVRGAQRVTCRAVRARRAVAVVECLAASIRGRVSSERSRHTPTGAWTPAFCPCMLLSRILLSYLW